jgi:ribokinase
MFDVITFGAATRDVFLRSKAMELHRERGVMEACFIFGAKIPVEDLVLETGGGGSNNAVTFARMAKLKTAVVARVGNDAAGEEIIAVLKKDGVNTSFVQRDPKNKTGYSTIILSREAERTILTHRGAAALLDAAKIPWDNFSPNFSVSPAWAETLICCTKSSIVRKT